MARFPNRSGARRGSARIGAALVLFALLLAGCGDAPAGPDGERVARVTRVSDGDTIALSGVGTVRLIGIDTPEVFGEPECFGREASAFVRRLLPRGRRVRYRIGTEPRDRYGRALAYVWLGDGRMVNELLAAEGYARPLAIAPNTEFARRFEAAARRAREAGRGLWGEPDCGEAERGSGAVRCADFATRAEAQRHFDRHGGELDGDGDGRACETLP